jgi:PhnB protein
MNNINIYLMFNGNCREAFEFYKNAFGGDFSSVSTFGDMPPQENVPPLPDHEKDKIMHMSLPIGKDTELMGSDTSEAMGKPPVVGNNFSISVSTQDKLEAEETFNQLSEGGNVTMPMEKTFWSPYFGMLTDKFGINWMISVEPGEQV